MTPLGVLILCAAAAGVMEEALTRVRARLQADLLDRAWQLDALTTN